MGRSQAASSQTSKSKTLVCGEWGTWVIVWVHVLSLSSSTSVGHFFLGLIHTVRTMGDSDSTRTRHSALAHDMRPMRARCCPPCHAPPLAARPYSARLPADGVISTAWLLLSSGK